MIGKTSKKSLPEVLERIEKYLRAVLDRKEDLSNEKIHELLLDAKSAMKQTEHWKAKMAIHDIGNLLQYVHFLIHVKDDEFLKSVLDQIHEMKMTITEDYYPTKENLAELIKQEVQRANIRYKNGLMIETDLENIEHEVDKYAFKSMIRNLLTNSIQNMKENDTLLKAIRIRLRDMGNHIEIVHEDTGTGIAEGVDPFGGKTTRAGGSGTGGQIIKKVVELHGGKIDWENKKEGGVRFVIKLPKKRRKVK